ncbi:MAG: dockerin type I repeat-containing protein [Ruminococcus sp.]|nr:dockerin type I repeat-containing protein [Ruminococcus sp.]
MKKLLSLVLVVVFIFSVSTVAFAETPTFSKVFKSNEDMCAYIEKYSADYPNVDYVDGELTTPIKGYELKQKDLLVVTVDNPDFVMTELSCGETAYEYGIDYTQCTFVKNDETTIYIDISYKYNSDRVMSYVEYFASMEAWGHEFCCHDGEVYIGEVAGYYYEAFYYSAHNYTSYRIAADDVWIRIDSSGAFDEDFINSLVIEKSGIKLSVLEVSPNAPIMVTDELLEAVRKDHPNKEINKEDINVTDYERIDDTKQLVRYIVADCGYTCDVVEQRIGDYLLYVPQRPLPQILKEAVLYDLDEAYESGIIDDEDLRKISWYSSKHFRLEKYEEIYGDVNGDKKITILDAAYVQRYLAGFRDAEIKYQFADFDEDGEITVFDATAIQRKIAGLAD